MGFNKIGIGELILILIIALVVFGPSKLPEMGRSIGEAINQFKSATNKITDDLNDDNEKNA